jgi:hypothetical protein
VKASAEFFVRIEELKRHLALLECLRLYRLNPEDDLADHIYISEALGAISSLKIFWMS